MKKLFAFLFALMAGTGILFAASGTCGDNLTWDLTNGVLTISGTGSMTNWTGNPHAPWYADRTSIQSVVINEGVASIGDAAFFNCTALSTVTVPQSITRVGDNVFVGCSALTAINVASGNAKYCSSYGVLFNKEKTKLIRFPAGMQGTYTYAIPDGVTLIGEYAFQRSLGMTSVIIPGSVNEIGWNAFDGCETLTSITCNAVTPPDCGNGNDRFDKVDPSIPVYVPEGTVDAYKAAPGWSDFTNIQVKCLTASGTCGIESGNLSWELSCEGVLTVSGIGEMEEWSKQSDIPWRSYRSSITSVVIEEGVTSIGMNAFYQNTKINSVKIANSVTRIGNYAFASCSALSSIPLGEGLTVIDENAFFNCTALTSVTIPNSVESIGKGAFKRCTSLSSVTIGKGVTSLLDEAFSTCTALTSISIPGNVTSIGDAAFTNCTVLSSVTISNGVESIGTGAFTGCDALTTITIPSSVANIGVEAFAPCLKLKSIEVAEDNPYYCSVDGILFNKDKTVLVRYPGNKKGDKYIIPNSVTSIGDYAFHNCSNLHWVIIPGSVKNIGQYAFYYCNMLTNITCYATTPPTSSSNCFSNVAAFTLEVPSASVEVYKNTVPWSYASSIKALPDIPASGTCGNNLTWTLDENGLLTISGTGAMTDWNNEMQVPWRAILDSYLDFIDSVVIEEGATNIGSYAFQFCDINAVTIPNSVQTIGKYAFGFCDALTSVTFGNGLRNIEEHAFSKCSSLGTVTLPQGVTAISDYTFEGCSKLTSVKINGNMQSIGVYAFSQCPQLADFDIPATVTEIGKYAFSGCSSLTSVTIPDGMKHIEDGTFYSCSGLTSVTIPAGVGIQTNTNNIGERAFYNCTSLESIICNAVNPPVCGTDAFYGVSTYTQLYVPEESVGAYKNTSPWKQFTIAVIPATSGTCGAEGDNLTWELADGVLTISGTGAMADYSNYYPAPWDFHYQSIQTVVVGDGVTGIGNYAIYNLTQLTSVTLPASLDSVGFWGLAFNEALTTITLPENVTKLADYAFYGCTGLQTINCESVVPPACGQECFGMVNTSDLSVYVPDDAFNAYKTANVWKELNIIPASQCLLASGTCGKDITWRLSCSGELTVEGSGVITPLDTDHFPYPWDEYASSIKLVVIGEGITRIGGEAFSNLDNLKAVSLPNSLITIEHGAFHGCAKLTSVSIPKNVIHIYDKAFSHCYGLTNIIFHGLTSIYENAFVGCGESLASITCFSVEPLYCLGLAVADSEIAGKAPSIPLYVPGESIGKYKAFNAWKDFNIKPLGDRPGTHIIASGTIGDITWELDSNGILTIRGAGNLPDWTKPAPKSVGKHYLPTEDPTAPWYPYLSEILYIVIESGITGIGDYAFYGCVNVQSITCEAVTPPTCGSEAFGGIDTSIPLIVPENSVTAYQSAAQWQNFNVQADERPIPEGIENILTPETGTQKVLREGQIFILRDGKIYDIHGTVVR